MGINTGESAPDFTLHSHSAGPITLSKLKGKKVVLFFYPKDDTPGCTKESCEFRDRNNDFTAKNALIFGISADDVTSHTHFAKKYSLSYPLLADTDNKVCEAYGVWGEQEWNGKKYMGIARTTFVINEQGNIHRVYQNVNPVGHAAQILAEL